MNCQASYFSGWFSLGDNTESLNLVNLEKASNNCIDMCVCGGGDVDPLSVVLVTAIARWENSGKKIEHTWPSRGGSCTRKCDPKEDPIF